MMCAVRVRTPATDKSAVAAEAPGIGTTVAPAMIASIMLLPIVVVDSARFSNRFVGPIFRLRGAMKRLANGEKVEPFQFRKDDFWRDVPDDFNRIAERLQSASQPTDVEVEVEAGVPVEA